MRRRRASLELQLIGRGLATGLVGLSLLAAPLPATAQASSSPPTPSPAVPCEHGILAVAGCALKEVGGNVADGFGVVGRVTGRFFGLYQDPPSPSHPAPPPSPPAPPPVIAPPPGPPPAPPPRYETKTFALTTPPGAAGLLPTDQVILEDVAAYTVQDHAIRVLVEVNADPGDARSLAVKARLVAKGVEAALIHLEYGQFAGVADGGMRISVYF